MKLSPLIFASLAVVGLAASGCRTTASTTDENPTPATQISQEHQVEIDRAWNVCVICHGDSGEGNGKAAPRFPVPPRGFGDPAWQDSTSDDTLRLVILKGGGAVGLSAIMPAHSAFADKPEVVDGLVAKIRSFAP